MKRVRVLALSMPFMVLIVFLLTMFFKEIPRGTPVRSVWKGECRNLRVPDWGIIRNSSELEDLLIMIPETIPEIEIDFRKEMLLYLVTGPSEEALGGYVIRRVRQENGGFSVICTMDKGPFQGRSPLCELAVSQKKEGEGLFNFE